MAHRTAKTDSWENRRELGKKKKAKQWQKESQVKKKTIPDGKNGKNPEADYSGVAWENRKHCKKRGAGTTKKKGRKRERWRSGKSQRSIVKVKK